MMHVKGAASIPYWGYSLDDVPHFDNKYKNQIFTVFQRLHGRNEYEGTGIGLATCRKIAERHGGEIDAESQPGEGAVFTVTLPVRHGQEGVA